MSIMFRSSHTRHPFARATAVIAIAALALTGCSAVADGGAGAGTPAEDSGPIAMTVARGQVNIENTIIAEEQGIFKDAGLTVEAQVSQGAAATNSAVISGEFDVALTDAISATRAVSEGMPIVVVAGQKHASPDHPVESGVLLPPGSPIKSWKDFEGKKIGIPDLGGLPQLTVQQALKVNGLDPKSVQFVALPLPALPAAAAKGDVDAIFVFSVFYFGAVSNGFTPLGTGVAEVLPDSPQSVWIASRQYAEKNSVALDRFRSALEKANTFAAANDDAVRAVYHENMELPAEFIDNVMVLAPLSVDLPKNGWDLLVKVMVENNELPKALTYEDIVWEGAL